MPYGPEEWTAAVAIDGRRPPGPGQVMGPSYTISTLVPPSASLWVRKRQAAEGS